MHHGTLEKLVGKFHFADAGGGHDRVRGCGCGGRCKTSCSTASLRLPFGAGLSTCRTPLLASSCAPRLLRCLLRAGLLEELRAELRDGLGLRLMIGYLVEDVAITFQNFVGRLPVAVRRACMCGCGDCKQ